MIDNKLDIYTVHAYKKLTRVRPALPSKLLDSFHEAGVNTCKDFLLQFPLTLMKQVDIDYQEYITLNRIISKSISPSSSTILSLLQSSGSSLRTTLKQVDSTLHGGLPPGIVTEITGPAGCGKTQLCLQLSVIAALPLEAGGLNTNVLYLDTESTFSATRLLEIAANRFPEHLTGEYSMNLLSERILVYTINDYDSLTTSLDKIEETLIRGKVGLIVLDSVASVIRAEFHGDDFVKLSTGVSRLAATLKYLADTFRIPVIVTNQITHASVQNQDILYDPTFSEGQDSLQATAALGLAWSHSVNIRIILQYWREDVKTLTIAKSPYTANVTYPYTIKREGIVIEADLQGMVIMFVIQYTCLSVQ